MGSAIRFSNGYWAWLKGYNDNIRTRIDDIYLKKPYQLVYTNSLAPEQFAIYEVMGESIVAGVAFNSSFSKRSFNNFRAEKLIPVVENWGLKQLNLPYAENIPKAVKKMFNQAYQEDVKAINQIMFYLNAYMALNMNSIPHWTYVFMINDRVLDISEAKAHYEHCDEYDKKSMSQKRFIEVSTSLGCLIHSYPHRSDLKNYLMP